MQCHTVQRYSCKLAAAAQWCTLHTLHCIASKQERQTDTTVTIESSAQSDSPEKIGKQSVVGEKKADELEQSRDGCEAKQWTARANHGALKTILHGKE